MDHNRSDAEPLQGPNGLDARYLEDLAELLGEQGVSVVDQVLLVFQKAENWSARFRAFWSIQSPWACWMMPATFTLRVA